MKKYLGVKIIQAEPMFSTDKEKEGYKVIYEDGYVSWSPKDVFEKAYRQIEASSDEAKVVFVNPKTGNWRYAFEGDDTMSLEQAKNDLKGFNKSVKALDILEQQEKKYKETLLLINDAKRAIFYRYIKRR